MDLTIIQKIAVWALPVLFAITLHEVAHGWVASLFGDQTARLTGRLTLNPLYHIDLMGTIVIPILMLLLTPFMFGWAKPVPVDSRQMRHPRVGMICVGLAGPLANLAMALGWGLIAKLGMLADYHNLAWLGVPLEYMGGAGILINIFLGVLNLVPLPPLDGGSVVANLLPPRAGYYYSQIEPYGFFILLLMMVTGVLSGILMPVVFFLMRVIGGLFGLA